MNKKIDKEYVEIRANNWSKKVSKLYNFVNDNLSNNDIECIADKKMVMYEELMQKFNVPKIDIPILNLRKNKTILASFKPIGLWVIGANGRIDILTKNGAFILADMSENDEQTQWKVYSPENRKEGVDFDSNFINKLVAE